MRLMILKCREKKNNKEDEGHKDKDWRAAQKHLVGR